MIRLKNGIKIIFIKNNKKYININFTYMVGNKNESDLQCGFAHLLEHLFLRSTRNKKYSEIIKELESCGAQINACTKMEFTHFYMDCLLGQFKNSFDLFLDLLINDYYNDDEFVKAVNIVNEEIELYKKSPIDVLNVSLNKNIYDCGMKNSITDRKFENIPQLSDLIDFKNKYYRSDNLVVTISGKITHSIKKYIRYKLLAVMQGDSNCDDCSMVRFQETVTLPYCVEDDKQIIIGKRYIYPTNNFDDFVKIKILGKILGGSISSRLFNNLREDKGLVYSIYSYSDMFVKHATLSIVVYVGPDKYKTTLSLLDENLSKDQILTISLNEFKKAKMLLCLNFAKEFSENCNLSHFVSESYFIYSLQLNYKKFIKNIKKIKYNDFMNFCNSINNNWYNSIVQY